MIVIVIENTEHRLAFAF